MKGWGANLGADLRARKGALLGQIKTLDDLADGPGLSPDDWTRRYSLDAELMGIFRSEELFWKRRGGQNCLLKGDANTAYFQAIANDLRRKYVIPFLRDGDDLLENPEDISSHIYSFYRELFSTDLRGGSSLREDFWPLADQVSDVENAELTLPFSSEEVGQAIASMKACSAPGPDGLPVVFFHRFWETVRPVVMPMFHEFYIGTLDMGRINFGVIALIPKLVGAAEIRQFRPITGRRIHDGILALHEIVHEVASKGMKGVFLKLDFQKAYDRLDWSFLRGVKQGEPISPLLFNLTLDALAGILDKAKLAGHIQGVVGHLIPGGGVSHLQYADDTMIMVSGTDSDIANLKFLLLCFEEMFGLKINFDKSEVVVLGYSKAEQHRIADNLNCKLAAFPISYLGMPLAESRILLLRDLLPSGTEVLKCHGPGNGICPLCHVPETSSHILFSCVAAQALWCFVPEALGPEWEASDLADFLQVRGTQVGHKRRLFWMVFAAMMWTLWTTRNNMMIEKVFQRHASDSFFKFLAFLQHWHPLVRTRDRDRLQHYLDALMAAARRLSSTLLAA
ncbi:hypothetical protein D1007_14083 [Hordeum vulgare]|nr:hypothetical protein D1007_14083 [Hordeum vulgare]